MKVQDQIKLIFCGLFISVSAFSAVPADSAYAKQEGQFFMSDDLQDNLVMPSFLLCFMQQLAADKMAGPSPVTYLALIDEDSCNASSQVASGAQVETKAAAASAKAGESTVNYKKVTVTVSQASGNDPMNVKAWVPVEGGMTVYTYGSAVKPVSETNIFGEFSFVYTGRVDGLGDVLKGQMSASGSQIIWSQTEYIPEAEQWFDWKATINIGSGTSGNGAVQHIGSAGTIDISSYAYTEDNFCRQLKLRNGSAISADEECFFTDELKGKKQVFNYSLFNSSTGAVHDLAQGGFGIKFTVSGQTKYGYADYNGVHFDEDTSKALSDAQAFTVADPSNSRDGDSVSLDIIQSSLRKITSSKVSLNSLDGIRINAFLPANGDVTNLGTAGEYNLSYDADNNRFIATKLNNVALGTALNFSVSEILAADGSDKVWGIGGWAPGVGGIYIPRDAFATPASSLVVKDVEERVSLSDLPSNLYCLEQCPGYTAIEAAKTKIGNDQGPASVYGGIGFGGSSSDFVTYTLNNSTYNYGDGAGDVAIGSVSSSLYTKLDNSDLGYGIYSGLLVTAKSQLACPAGNGVDFCMIPIWDGDVTTTYRITTGHKPWHQTRRLLDSSNNKIGFTAPQLLYFTAPNDSTQYGEFAGKELSLEFNGGRDLYGIPGRCLNKTTGVFTDNCFVNGANPGAGFWPWVQMFRIPKNETSGLLYTGAGQTGTSYLVAPNEGLVFLGLNASAKGTLTLGDATNLPSGTILNVGPSGGANYIGSEPTQPSTPSIRAGERIVD
jgi:hypothetical protein